MVNKEGIDLEDLKSMPKPKIECKVTFYFEKNHNKEEIEKILNKNSLYSVIKDKAVENVKKKKLNRENIFGYISFDFGSFESFNCEKIIADIVNCFYERKNKIKNINKKLGGKINFLLDILLTSFNTPYVYMNNEILKKMSELNMSFEESVNFYDYTDFKNTISKLKYED